MSEEIVSRLMRSHRYGNKIAESLTYKRLHEAGEDEEDLDFDDSDDIAADEFEAMSDEREEYDREHENDEESEDSEFNDEEFEPDSDSSNSPMTSHAPSREDRGGEEHTTDPDTIAKEPVEEKSNNPLDNEYAVNYTLGQEVSLTYSDGKASQLVGTIEGYDQNGFYRVKWGNGMTTSGITDIALADFVGDKSKLKENKCVCGSTKFVNESSNIVCDKCGRIIREADDPLSRADRSRPKGKRMIRSTAHDMSTSIGENKCIPRKKLRK